MRGNQKTNVKTANKRGTTVNYDPNHRPILWKSIGGQCLTVANVGAIDEGMNERHVMDFTMEEPWRVFRIMAEFVDGSREAVEFIKKHRPGPSSPAPH
jgi:uncharacterized protein (DUF608 family)